MKFMSKIAGIKTKEYMLWTAMKRRCKINEGAYIGCTMSEDFQDFQKFATWCNSQVGFNVPGYQLDKDLLQGNKDYNGENCVFLPRDLNCFNRINEGAYSQGVCWHEKLGKYRARIQIVETQERVHLGVFCSEGEAFNVYKAAKEAQALIWYERLKAGEFIVDGRVIERMKTWTLEKQ